MVKDLVVGNLVEVWGEYATEGMMVPDKYLRNRRYNVRGLIYAVEHHNDQAHPLVWVQHGKDKRAPYWAYELVLVGVRCEDKD